MIPEHKLTLRNTFSQGHLSLTALRLTDNRGREVFVIGNS